MSCGYTDVGAKASWRGEIHQQRSVCYAQDSLGRVGVEPNSLVFTASRWNGCLIQLVQPVGRHMSMHCAWVRIGRLHCAPWTRSPRGLSFMSVSCNFHRQGLETECSDVLGMFLGF